jgi:regulator of RNase E activity RraB
MEDRDYKVIEALKDNGSDVSKPHEIDFFLDFEKLEQAAPVAQAMDKDGFNVRMFENGDGTFTIEAKKVLIPSLETMQDITKKLSALTKNHGGKYDGWGTEVVE